MHCPELNHVRLEQNGPVLTITLNRPEVRNAINAAMSEELNEVLQLLHGTEEIRVVVLRGAGGNFCAGGDLGSMGKMNHAGQKDRESIAAFNAGFGHMLGRWMKLPQVVIAFIEGGVMGGGVGLASISDVAIAAPSAKFSLTETTLGLPPSQILPYVYMRTGLTQARALALTGARLNGEEALNVGLVHYAEDSEEAARFRVAQLVRRSLKAAPKSNAFTKALLVDIAKADFTARADELGAGFADVLLAEEAKEGIASFSERRAPAWHVDIDYQA
ncbi:enoyl-CoA hydratase/isomerase family protein [Haliea atlantica]